MAPSNTNEVSKSSKMIVKRLWSKLLTPKEKAKKNKCDNDWVLDSAPDYAFEENTTKQNKNEQMHSNEAGKNKENVPESVKVEETAQDGKEEKRKSDTKETNSEASPTQIIYNLNFTDGNVHIGSSSVKTFNIQQNFHSGPSKKGKDTKSQEKKRMKKTAEIEAVLQSSQKLDVAHITYLANHFGSKWRDIGQTLEFSNGDLDRFENASEDDLWKVSFEMLNEWIMRNGDLATVGRLCVKLWSSRIINAREAVKLFADNFDNFN